MENQRSTAILLVIILLAGIWGLILLFVFFGNVPVTFFWGVPIGSILGFGTAIYLSQTWDPERLEPKGNRKKATNRVLWMVPLGILLATILPDFLGDEITDLLAGTAITWASWALAYAAIQAYRHRPK